MNRAPEMDNPLNSMERFLAHVSYRLDIIIEQNNSIIEHLANQGNVAVVENKAEIQVEAPVEKLKKTTRKK